MKYLFSLLLPPAVLLAGLEPTDAQKVMKILEGTWTVVSWEKDGKPVPEKAVKGMHMIFAKDMLTIKQGKKTHGAGTFKIAAGQKPHAIDYKESKEITSVYDVGIFEIEGAGNLHRLADAGEQTK